MLQDLEFLTNQYFTFDKPVPLKGELFIYPVKVIDYYTFFSVVDILMIDKNTNPETIPMSYLKFLHYLSQSPEGHQKRCSVQHSRRKSNLNHFPCLHLHSGNWHPPRKPVQSHHLLSLRSFLLLLFSVGKTIGL